MIHTDFYALLSHENNSNMTKCFVCGSTDKIYFCANCRKISYCSKNCQIIDWKNHKKTCINVAEVQTIDNIFDCTEKRTGISTKWDKNGNIISSHHFYYS